MDLPVSTPDTFVSFTAAQGISAIQVPKKSPPASLIEAWSAFGAAFDDRVMPADRVLYGAA